MAPRQEWVSNLSFSERSATITQMSASLVVFEILLEPLLSSLAWSAQFCDLFETEQKLIDSTTPSTSLLQQAHNLVPSDARRQSSKIENELISQSDSEVRVM